MAFVVGIDLGTTNSLIACLEDGQPWVIPDPNGDLLHPSYVGVTEEGQLLVGQAARRQYAAAPERTVKSIKRRMGTDYTVQLNDQTYRPQEISAILLRSLKQCAETELGDEIKQAVITVPAFFTDAQRQATKEAGEIAGLEVLQILNEPTAAALVFDSRTDETQRVLIYDLGGGTFDVSIVEISGPVREVLASHGNNRLGGDDFDRQLQRHLADRFVQIHDRELPDDAAVQARLLQAAERTKISLSEQAFVTVREPFLVSDGDQALHLEVEIARGTFEQLIQPQLRETLEAIDRALEDAGIEAADLDRVILVGGSTRIPLIEEMVQNHLPDVPINSFEPDRCVAMGAALQAGVLSGEDIENILVDVTPHSLGIAAAMNTPMGLISDCFSTIIPRNSVIPVSRSNVYSTTFDRQTTVEIDVYQGENSLAKENVPLGSFLVEGLPPMPAGKVQVEVHFDFDLNGILKVTATEKGGGKQETLVVNDAETGRLSSQDLDQSRQSIASMFERMVEAMPEEDALLEEEGMPQPSRSDLSG